MGLAVALLVTGVWADSVVISEFVARNSGPLRDEDGDTSDWIEVLNAGSAPVDLAGWYLTDDAGALTKWTFPSRLLDPGSLLVVFASGKDRSPASGPLHANFRLRGEGEYLALVHPDGVTLASEFSPAFPPQKEGFSYGLQTPVLLDIGTECEYLVPSDGSADDLWTEIDFNASGWERGPTGLGYERATGYESLIKTDLGAAMFGRSNTVYMRVPFHLPDPDRLTALLLSMQYDDGFIAYINGRRVKSQNAPRYPAWDSMASDYHDDPEVFAPSVWSIRLRSTLLRPGANVLAIHGLNNGKESSDFLIAPRLIGLGSSEGTDTRYGFLGAPTPGAPNGMAGAGLDPAMAASLLIDGLGPPILSVDHAPAVPEPGEPLVVAARVEPRKAPVAAVTLHYRPVFAPEATTAMRDDGAGPDRAADDGVYAGSIPALGDPGQMLRWYVTTADTAGHQARYPEFGANRSQYLGTVVEAEANPTALPVLHWFVENPAAAETDAGTRASLFFRGEFYDNVFVRHRGLWTTSWPKRKFKFDFNPGEHFRYDPDQPRVEEFNLQSHYWEWEATSYMRETLAYRFLNDAGTPAPLAFHLQLRQNGAFFGLYSFVEQVDETFLERNGLDPRSPMYKALQDGTLAPDPTDALYRKVNRRSEPWNDLAAFTDGLSGLGTEDRFTYLFDNVDLAQIINEMAAQTILTNHDRLIKNYYVYLDPATQEWHRVPWDTEAALPVGERLTDEHWVSPLFGDNDHTQELGYPHWINFLVDAVLDHRVTRQMYLRRLRSLADRFLSAEDKYFEDLIEATRAEIAADAAADNRRWQFSSFSRSVDGLLGIFLPYRRTYLFAHSLVPASQAEEARVDIGHIEAAPGGGRLGEAYVELVNPNSAAVDLSGWRLHGQYAVEFQPGTVIGAEPGPAATGPIYDDGLAPGWELETRRARTELEQNLEVYEGSAAIAVDAEAQAADLAVLEFVPETPLAAGSLTGLRFVFRPAGVRTTALNRFTVTVNGRYAGAGDLLRWKDGVRLDREEWQVVVVPIQEVLSATGQVVKRIRLSGGLNGRFYLDDIRLVEVHGGDGQPGSVPPDQPARLFVAADVVAFRAREHSPRGGERLYAQGNYPGFLAPAGGTVELRRPDGRLVASTRYDGLQAENRVVINEIMYRGPEEGDPGDWVEVYNRGRRDADLSGWVLGDSEDAHAFVVPPGTRLEAEGHLVLCRDPDAFAAAYPEADLCVGGFEFGLAREGELVRLLDASGAVADWVDYGTREPWPTVAGGGTLSLKAPDLDNAQPEHWVLAPGLGTPGAANATPTAVLGPDRPGAHPHGLSLEQNRPNPCNPTTTIRFGLPGAGRAEIAVYDALGQRVGRVLEEERGPGYHEVAFDASGLASGVYFCRIRWAGRELVRKMAVVR